MSSKNLGQYYPLTQSMGKILRESGFTASEWRIWSYFVEIESWGNCYKDTSALETMSICNVSQATYFRAIAKFKELNLFDIQDKGISIKNNYGIKQLQEDYQNCETATLKNDNATLKNDNEFSKMIVNSQICESQNSELLPDIASGSPKINKINKSLKTLSDSEEENLIKIFPIEIEEEEREEKKLASLSNKISSEESERSHLESPEEIVNDSDPLKNAEQPRLKPKNLSSRGKGFASPSSINVQKRTLSSEFQQLVDLYGLKRTVERLKKTQLPFDQYEPFLTFARKRIKSLKTQPANPDLLVVAHLDSYVADFNYERNKQGISEKTVEQKRIQDNRSVSLNDRLALAFEQAYEENLAQRGVSRADVPGNDLEIFKSEAWRNSPIRRQIIDAR